MKIRLSYFLPALLLLAACSSESNTWISRAFHNTTAHYNGYYYALEEVTKVEQAIQRNHRDDYNQILWLFPRLDSTFAKSYDKSIQEAVKMASIAIQRHPNSKWVDDAYILVGKARLYSFDWGNAIQTFKYVNNPKVTKDIHTRHRALIYLIRTFTEHKEYNNAEAVFDYLQKEPLNRVNKKNFLLEKAYYYQVRNDLDKMIRSLSEAVPLLTKKDKPGRIYFIIGQVYQTLGFEAEAYNYYRECISTNPEYEVDFYARLYMAQVAEISKARNVANARKSFRKLLKDSKNKEFRDKIYYEIGVFEEKQNNITEAITSYNQAIRLGNNKLVDGEAYLRLGELYYDTLKKYELAQAYYDSAVSSISAQRPDYGSIKQRQEVLSEFVTHLKTISWQDSLLLLSGMDTSAIRLLVKQAVEITKPVETGKSKKRKRERTDITQNLPANENSGPPQTGDWYFGNPSAVGLGQIEFVRIWGKIPLEDNWRRSERAIPPSERLNPVVTGNVADTEKIKPESKQNPAEEAYQALLKQLPFTNEQKKESLSKIEEAYFALGNIYYFRLNEKNNAIVSFEKLLERFPQTLHKPEALYQLYLIHKDTDPKRAETFASSLIAEYPESAFARILVNPDYLLESSLTADKQKAIYKEAYEHFLAGNYAASTELLNQALNLETTPFTPQVVLLRTLITGKTESLSVYQFQLEELIKGYPDTEQAAYAKTLLSASREFQTKNEKAKGIEYNRSFEQPHYFIIVFTTTEKIEAAAVEALSAFNALYFNDLNLKVSNLILNEEYTLTMVSDLPRISSALEYYKTFTEKLQSLTGLKNRKFNSFVITKDNFNIFYRTKGLDEYLRFFEKNYRTENP
ncbi:MAG: tetratricopeptide repeat protein [Flammeovirgaceae bacterium]|nr:MAG: tetratricopeptide repeat protein [Flammeovirgaceae bacterium]